MTKEEIETAIQQLDLEEGDLRLRLSQLEDKVQNAPGAHSPGTPSVAVMEAEREIRSLVLRLTDIDRERNELTVARSLAK
jgi:hypothetical protein